MAKKIVEVVKVAKLVELDVYAAERSDAIWQAIVAIRDACVAGPIRDSLTRVANQQARFGNRGAIKADKKVKQVAKQVAKLRVKAKELGVDFDALLAAANGEAK